MVHNRPRLTKQALETIGHHDRLLVLDDCCDLETKQVLYDAQVNVYALAVSKGTGHARNTVIKMSENCFGRGEYLYLSDNDVKFLAPDWLEILIKCYEMAWDRGFRVIGAYNHPYHKQGERLYTPDAFAVCEVQALALQSMLMRWEVWDKYGPFNETPVGRVCMGEDVGFTNRIRDDGGRIGVVSPALLVNTGITNSFGEHIPGWEAVKAECPDGVFCE